MTSATASGRLGSVGGVFYRLRGVRLHRPEPSGRTVLIGAMCLFLVVVLASPLQTYLSRRSAVAASLRQQAQLNAQVAQLQQQTALWNDPAYVERQARARLQYVRPGDTLYTVLGDGASSSDAAADEAKVAPAAHLPSWNSALWSSVLDSSKAG